MPQSSEEMRARWGGEQGVGEDKALAFLKKHGWKEVANGYMLPSDGATDEQWDAMQFLVEEWDFAVARPDR
jgi:hypothetical protein